MLIFVVLNLRVVNTDLGKVFVIKLERNFQISQHHLIHIDKLYFAIV